MQSLNRNFWMSNRMLTRNKLRYTFNQKHDKHNSLSILFTEQVMGVGRRSLVRRRLILRLFSMVAQINRSSFFAWRLFFRCLLLPVFGNGGPSSERGGAWTAPIPIFMCHKFIFYILRGLQSPF